jgi:hypothetical protein
MSETSTNIDMSAIRTALSRLPVDVSHDMWQAPEPEEIYAPPDHAGALDPTRALVVGGRGMGKSFWAGAYVSEAARGELAGRYPGLGLERVLGVAGFTGGEGAAAPSPRVLGSLISEGMTADDVWRGVMIRVVRRAFGRDDDTQPWKEFVAYAAKEPEAVEQEFSEASNQLQTKGQRLIAVFDALDRLGTDWPSIRERARGLLRTTLALRSYRSIGVKIFMRPDQFDDYRLFGFPDASKLRAAAVRLRWEPRDLYGLLFMQLLHDIASKPVFQEIAGLNHDEIDLPPPLREDPGAQERVFIKIAGQYMGVDRRRGRVYTWLTNHLGDANGEVSPRSFLTALRTAAEHRPEPAKTAIDPAGIRAGVVKASAVRLDQLAEDYDWIRMVLDPLASQRVPCPEEDFIRQWREAGTIAAIYSSSVQSQRLPPVELEATGEEEKGAKEAALIEALVRLGVVERRGDNRINMPDIFRVAARLLRKGGVKATRR